MRRIAAAITAALPLLCAAGAGAVYLPQERIPTDSPIYRDLERLATTFGLTPRFLSTRPLRREEALAFLEDLAERDLGAESDPAFERAERFLDPEAPGATRPLVSLAGDEEERLEISPYASFLYADDPRNDPEINRDYRVGVAASASLDSTSIFVVDFYEGTASQGGRGTPDFGDKNALIEGVNFNSWMREAYAELAVSRVRLLLGHTWLRWGPGRDGTLALSDAAPALDMLRGEAGLFRRLRYSQTVALLDPGPETYVAGHRVEWQAHPGLTVGVTELARFDGTSQAILYSIPFVPYSFWEKRPKSGGVSPTDSTGELLRKNNVLWSADASWIVHPGVRLYGELLLDDISFSTDYKPDMIGYQAGVDGRRAIGGGSAAGVIVEYTRIHNFVYSAWHRHDFAFDGFPLGYPLGPDVQSLTGEIALEWGADWELRLRGEWRRKGEGAVGDPWLPSDGEADASRFQGIVEEEARIGGSVIYAPRRAVRLEGSAGASSMENRRHVPTGRDDRHAFRLFASLSL